jgi:hypothetical protein
MGTVQVLMTQGVLCWQVWHAVDSPQLFSQLKWHKLHLSEPAV